MKSLLLSLLLLVVLAGLGHSLAVSETPLLDFLYLLRGTFVNAKQVEQDIKQGRTTVHTLIRINLVPVDIPALRPAYTVFLEQDADERVNRQQILRVSAADDEGNIQMQVSNFTDRPQVLSQRCDVSSLSDLRPSDLVSREECNVYLKQVERNVFVGTWADCTSPDSKGVPRRYTSVVTCNAFSGVLYWKNNQEIPSPVPYIMSLKNRRPPLVPSWLGDVPNYISPCPDN